MKLFLCGDVMTGRGIDQIMGSPSMPRIHEDYVKSAIDYVAMAELRHGRIPRPAGPAYIWGDALGEMARAKPDARIINLETSITTSEDAEPKGINYRMHPANISCLAAAKIDCCCLANNHVLDWGRRGLDDTLCTLRRTGIRTAGAGATARESESPAIVETSEGSRVLVFGIGGPDCGIPPDWAATERRSGVDFFSDYSPSSTRAVAKRISRMKQPGDVIMVSIHWGWNWGYSIPRMHREFAHVLIDEGQVDVIHGHSSHHPKGIEVYRNRLVLYGCGDFINDYEGIGGFEQFRSELTLMYCPTLDARSGELMKLEMSVFEMRRFQLIHAGREGAMWLLEMLNRQGMKLGTHFTLDPGGGLSLT